MKILPADVEKEVRALAMPWLASAAVIVLGSSGAPLLRGFEAAAYFLGVSVLGGLAIGQEYSHRTLGTFLALPVRRERMFIVKWSVLAVLLLALDAIMWASNAEARAFASHRDTLLLVALPTLCALCVAPCLTMWSRSALAGAVLAGGLPGTVFVTTQLIIYWVTGNVLDETFILARTTPLVCAIAAVMSWRMFMRLEAIEGGGRDLRLPAWSSDGIESVTRRNPTWLLIKKEIALQQIPLAIGGVMILGWMVAMTLRTTVAHITAIFNVLVVSLVLSNAAIIGAVAAAEERQLGTHEWQLLLPVPVVRQWLIKVMVAVILTLGLCVLLPSPLLYFINGPIATDTAVSLLRLSFVIGAAVVTALGLYFSSLSTSGLRAVVLAVAAIALGVIPGARLASMRNVSRYTNSFVGQSLDYYGYYALSANAQTVVLRGVQFTLAAGFIFILLRFGLTNYRSAAPIGRHLWWQGLVIGLCLSTAAFILSASSLLGMI